MNPIVNVILILPFLLKMLVKKKKKKKTRFLTADHFRLVLSRMPFVEGGKKRKYSYLKPN